MSEEKEKGFPGKWEKLLTGTGFMEEAEGMDEEALKKAVFQCESNIYVIEKDKEEDATLNAAKELVKEHSKPHNEAKRFQTAKIKYCMYLLENRGIELKE